MAPNELTPEFRKLEQGLLRNDVTVRDFVIAKGAVAMARPENARRLVHLLMDGLRAHPNPRRSR